jgi:hypothetical protein
MQYYADAGRQSTPRFCRPLVGCEPAAQVSPVQRETMVNAAGYVRRPVVGGGPVPA